MMPRLFNYFLIGALLFSMPVCSMSNLPANSATQTMDYSHFEESDMLLDKDDEWLHYLLYSASFMIGSFIIWAIVRFCLVVPRYKKIQQMEQHYNLVKNEYKSERELMSGQKEIVVSAEEKSERSVLATTSDLSRNYSDIPSSLKSDKPKIKKEPVVAETDRSARFRPKLHTTDKGPILVSDSSNYEEIGNVHVDDIYSAPQQPSVPENLPKLSPPTKSIKSAKLFSDEMEDAVPFNTVPMSMLSDAGRGLKLQQTAAQLEEDQTPFSVETKEKATEESTEEEKGSTEGGMTTSSSTEHEKEENEDDQIYKT
uniref:Candidate secreted effector n=1 Tax=Meloidogyne incognita TaxID=6306 RepID=A0A914KSW3_MELIC